VRHSGGGALALYPMPKRSADNQERASASAVTENPEQVSCDFDEASATLAEVSAGVADVYDAIARLRRPSPRPWTPLAG